MQSTPQPEQITKTVVGVTTVFIGGIALLSSVFVVPAGEVGVVTTLGKVSKTPREPGLNLKLPSFSRPIISASGLRLSPKNSQRSPKTFR